MAGSSLPLRFKTRNGNQSIANLTADTTVADLKALLSGFSDVSSERLKVLSGFPPKPLDLSCDNEPISSLGLKPRETLIIEELKPDELNDNRTSRMHDKQETEVNAADPVIHETSSLPPGLMMRQTVPSDNSCLFTSVNYCMTGGQMDHRIAPQLRKLIAECVQKDPQTYNSAFLGQENADYCRWILNPDHWGGAIELSILSQYYGIEIVAVDTINLRLNKFGEDKDYDQRIFLIYDGIHYDPLKYEPADGRSPISTVFPTSETRLLADALQVAKEAKQSKQYTDVQNFTLKCLVCGTKLTGQSQAQAHAKQTGHVKFDET